MPYTTWFMKRFPSWEYGLTTEEKITDCLSIILQIVVQLELRPRLGRFSRIFELSVIEQITI